MALAIILLINLTMNGIILSKEMISNIAGKDKDVTDVHLLEKLLIRKLKNKDCRRELLKNNEKNKKKNKNNFSSLKLKNKNFINILSKMKFINPYFNNNMKIHHKMNKA